MDVLRVRRRPPSAECGLFRSSSFSGCSGVAVLGPCLPLEFSFTSTSTPALAGSVTGFRRWHRGSCFLVGRFFVLPDRFSAFELEEPVGFFAPRLDFFFSTAYVLLPLDFQPLLMSLFLLGDLSLRQLV